MDKLKICCWARFAAWLICISACSTVRADWAKGMMTPLVYRQFLKAYAGLVIGFCLLYLALLYAEHQEKPFTVMHALFEVPLALVPIFYYCYLGLGMNTMDFWYMV